MTRRGTKPSTSKVEVHRIVLYVIDHDGVGAEGCKQVLESTRYPNWCIHPQAGEVETRVVDWHDEHPLNRRDTADETMQALFGSMDKDEQ